MSADTLSLWTIYKNPRDVWQPGEKDCFVLREWRVQGGSSVPMPLSPCAIMGTLEAARAWVPPGLVLLARSPSDDPCIVETWI